MATTARLTAAAAAAAAAASSSTRSVPVEAEAAAAAQTLAAQVRRPLRPLVLGLTGISLVNACSCHEILRAQRRRPMWCL
jgi:hypothetical protein